MSRNKKTSVKNLPSLYETRQENTLTSDELKGMPQVAFERHVRAEQISEENAKQLREGETFLVDRLSALLQWVRGFPQQARFERIGAKLYNRTPFNQIQYCSQALLSGALPDAETLEFVAIALSKYANSEGAFSLDEAFGLKSRPKAGNPARQFAHNNKIGFLLFHMSMLRAFNPKMALVRAAESALNGNESIPVETLEREYRRRGCSRWADGIKRDWEERTNGK